VLGVDGSAVRKYEHANGVLRDFIYLFHYDSDGFLLVSEGGIESKSAAEPYLEDI